MMRICNIIILMTILSSGNIYAFDCDLLIGTWKVDQKDDRSKAERESDVSYGEGGKYKLRGISHFEDGSSEARIEEGVWSCSDNHVIVRTLKVNDTLTEYTDLYKILDLTDDYRRFEALDIGCDEVLTDCPVIFQSFKVKL